MLVAGDVISPGTVISKVINSTTLLLSKPVGSIIGNTTRAIVIKFANEPLELETDPTYTETFYYLYLKSPQFGVNPPEEYEIENKFKEQVVETQLLRIYSTSH